MLSTLVNKTGSNFWILLALYLKAEKDLQKLENLSKVFYHVTIPHWASQVALVAKNPPANALDALDSDPVLEPGRSPGGNGNPLQCSCLENPMDREAW